MSDDTQYHTKDLSVAYCPGCEPERDPTREILVARWCPDHHAPDTVGLDDAAVQVPSVGAGIASEADGRNCKVIQGLVR